MTGLENQRAYWDAAGSEKTFTHPIAVAWLSSLAAPARIVDYGCGYGRVTDVVRRQGFAHIEGVDTSASLIERARRNHPDLTYGVFETDDGAVCRHHSAAWLQTLLLDHFIVAETREITVKQ